MFKLISKLCDVGNVLVNGWRQRLSAITNVVSYVFFLKVRVYVFANLVLARVI